VSDSKFSFTKTILEEEKGDEVEGWTSLSKYVREIEQGFSRFYKKRHGRKGFFWSERFKNVIVDNGDNLINCLAYIDLNPFRAGLVKKLEQYRWSSLGYHVQWKNRGGFLCLRSATSSTFATLGDRDYSKEEHL
jgi:hypothetical protein